MTLTPPPPAAKPAEPDGSPTDHDLLRAFARAGDQAAFARLVARHVDLVYGSALRRVRDRHAAEDVTQVVFHALARKAGSIGPRVVLAGWLFNATAYAAANALRADRRRARREREVARMTPTTATAAAAAAAATGRDAAGWDALAPHLEAGLARLPGHERDAVLLRFFQGKSVRETGAALGIGEDAAAKRLSRAVERLRQSFARRGVALPAAALGVLLSTRAVEAAPPSVATAAAGIGAAPAGATAAASADQVLRAIAWAKGKLLVSAGAGVAAVLGTLWVVASQVAVPAGGGGGPGPTVPVAIVPATAPAEFAARRLAHPGGRIMKGFPVALPGGVVGCAAVADLDGDGRGEIVVPTIHSGRGPLVHDAPRLERLVFALRADGSTLPGWPAVITDHPTRLRQLAQGGNANNWGSSPSVADADGDGRDDVAILDLAGTVTIRHGASGPEVRRVADSGDGLAAVPLVDLDGDGRLDFVLGWVLRSADGGPVPGWPAARMVRGGFAPAVGRASGDGDLQLYLPSYVEESVVRGLDRFGRDLPGWPQAVSGQCLAPVALGDVDGDGALEVAAVDSGGHLHLWTWDGQPLASTRATGAFTSVFKDGLSTSGGATLADLDGDGADEVIVHDAGARSIRAWRGDGRAFGAEPDGTVARLGAAVGTRPAGGVRVADLGDAGVIDLFCGTAWIRLTRGAGGTVSADVTDMLAPAVGSTQPAVTRPAAPVRPPPGAGAAPVARGQSAAAYAHSTLADVDRDGRTDVVIGLSDGRVFVYETDKPYRPERMLWPTAAGNFRRTGGRVAPPFVPAKVVTTNAGPLNVAVTDLATGAPLAGAVVTAAINEGQFPFAAADGRGVIRVPGERPTALWVARPGYATVRVDVPRGGGTPAVAAATALTVAMAPAVTVGGFVRDDQGRPVAGARVAVSARGPSPGGHAVDVRDATATADARGQWSVTAIPAHCDAVYLRAEYAGFAPQQSRVGRSARTRGLLYAGQALTVLLPEAGREAPSSENRAPGSVERKER